MKTIKISYPLNLSKSQLPETVAAIGFFDGIHIGHQQVIKTAVLEAKRRNMESAVITFYPHPSVVLKKDAGKVQYITPLSEKEAILKDLYVDRLYIVTFNEELSHLLPEQFIDHFIAGLNIKHLVAGFDYTYGHKGKGNMDVIEEHAKGRFTHTTIGKLVLDKEKVSSTRIRECLKEGNIEQANLLLGRPLSLTGTVEKGYQRGRTIGYPTANINVSDETLVPSLGIYAVKVYHQNRQYKGMASIGVNPTFREKHEKPSIEVNILDFDQDIYGEQLEVEFIRFVRPELKFENAEALIKQIEDDEVNIRKWFG